MVFINVSINIQFNFARFKMLPPPNKRNEALGKFFPISESIQYSVQINQLGNVERVPIPFVQLPLRKIPKAFRRAGIKSTLLQFKIHRWIFIDGWDGRARFCEKHVKRTTKSGNVAWYQLPSDVARLRNRRHSASETVNLTEMVDANELIVAATRHSKYYY